MLHYKVYQNKSKGNAAYGKWFARATVNQTIDLDKLAEHMSNHNTPYSKGAIYGVLTDMVNCIRELVLDGNAVKIPNLAIFSAGLTIKALTPARSLPLPATSSRRISVPVPLATSPVLSSPQRRKCRRPKPMTAVRAPTRRRLRLEVEQTTTTHSLRE